MSEPDQDETRRFEFEVAQAEQFADGLLDQIRVQLRDHPDAYPRDMLIARVTTNLYGQLVAANLATLAGLLLVRSVEADQS